MMPRDRRRGPMGWAAPALAWPAPERAEGEERAWLCATRLARAALRLLFY